MGTHTVLDVGGGFDFNTATLAYYIFRFGHPAGYGYGCGRGFAFDAAHLAYSIFSEKGNNHEPPYNPSKKYLLLRSDWKPAEVAKWSGGPDRNGATRACFQSIQTTGWPILLRWRALNIPYFSKMDAIDYFPF